MVESRKQFIQKMIAGGITVSVFPHLLAGNHLSKEYIRPVAGKNDIVPVRIALIGKGRMGTSDIRTALRVPGVKITAVCDLYDARLEDARKEWGFGLFVTKDYKEILSRDDVDAVFIGTTDHWHQKISIDAMSAGKHVYCEKPVIHKISECKDLIKAQQQSRCVFQVGSQGMSSLGNRKAKQLVENGAIGKINYIEAFFTAASRNQCKTPDNLSQNAIWWDQYIKNATKVPFQPERFFCWRHWKDYGTGMAGDLFVHVLASLQYITGSAGPEKIYTTGDTDGVGDTPCMMLGYFDYPDRNGLGAFKVSLGANHHDAVSKKWGSTFFTMVGDKGILEVEWDRVTLKSNKNIDKIEFNNLLPLGKKIDHPEQKNSNELEFAEEGYKNCHFDHIGHFFEAIRNKSQVEANVLFAVQSAAPAILCYESYLKGKPIYWDVEKLKV